MSPVDRAGPPTGTNFTLGSYEKLKPGFRDKKKRNMEFSSRNLESYVLSIEIQNPSSTNKYWNPVPGIQN